jgi:predicted flavoprotein YhiN
MGLSLKNVKVSLYCGNNKVIEEQGEMLFTHFGVSGPIILSFSSYIKDTNNDYAVKIDLKPALTEEE